MRGLGLAIGLGAAALAAEGCGGVQEKNTPVQVVDQEAVARQAYPIFDSTKVGTTGFIKAYVASAMKTCVPMVALLENGVGEEIGDFRVRKNGRQGELVDRGARCAIELSQDYLPNVNFSAQNAHLGITGTRALFGDQTESVFFGLRSVVGNHPDAISVQLHLSRSPMSDEVANEAMRTVTLDLDKGPDGALGQPGCLITDKSEISYQPQGLGTGHFDHVSHLDRIDGAECREILRGLKGDAMITLQGLGLKNIIEQMPDISKD